MGILDWSGLWFGLTLPAIVLMYLFKRKYIDTVVPSHLLWDRVLRNIEANRPWQKLQNRLLLWLQLLVAALLVFALMEPFVWTSGSGSGHTVIIVDTSASMSAAWNDGEAKTKERATSRLDKVKEQLKANIDAAGSQTEFTLVRLGSEPDVLLSREGNRSLLKQAVDELVPDYGKAAYRETLSLAEALTRDDPAAGVLVYTDDRWTERTDDIAFGGVPIQIVSVGEGTEANASIEQFGVKPISNQIKAAGIATVRNYRETSISANLDLYGDGKLLASKKITVEGGKSAQVSFEELARDEVYRLQLSPEDDYAPDNEAFAFLERGSQPDVLLLSPGNMFLEKALQLSGARVTRMNTASGGGKESEQSALPEDKPDMIVIDGAAPDYLNSEPWTEMLQDTPLWTWGGKGKKLPLTNGEVKTVSHPVTRYLSFTTPMAGELLDREMPAWGSPLLEFGGQIAAYAGTEAGQRRLSFLFALEDSDLPLRPEFPILVGNAVKWLQSGKASGLGRVTAGTEVDIPVPTEAEEAFWIPVDGYALQSGAGKIAAERNAGSVLSRQTSPGIPGLWRFEMKEADGENLSSYNLEVAADPAESGILGGGKTLSIGSSDQNSSSPAASAGSDTRKDAGKAKPLGASPLQSQRSLVSLVVLLALLVILAEWGVYQRGRSI
ncbi:BatA domain-containing protein [Paenibacillus puldeungensis]|uniref:BatA domain-containing protein n=1 Tax=Paenibacillus puldeungensis TaxID=696536 RepID=A0ABW3RSV9_9BACL